MDERDAPAIGAGSRRNANDGIFHRRHPRGAGARRIPARSSRRSIRPRPTCSRRWASTRATTTRAPSIPTAKRWSAASQNWKAAGGIRLFHWDGRRSTRSFVCCAPAITPYCPRRSTAGSSAHHSTAGAVRAGIQLRGYLEPRAVRAAITPKTQDDLHRDADQSDHGA